MIKTWSIEYCPIPDKYLLMLWLNDKAYYLDISKEFAEMLVGVCSEMNLFNKTKKEFTEEVKGETK